MTTVTSDEGLAAALEAAANLPALPETTLRLVELLADPNRARRDVVSVVQSDMALAGDALRSANAVVFRHLLGKVDSVDAAVGRIGESWLLRLALARVARGFSDPALAVYGMGAHGLWRQSLRAATAAELLAPRAGVSSPRAMTAGLLLDVGKLVCATLLQGLAGTEGVARSGADAAELIRMERLLIGVDHAAVGARLVASWGLPQATVDAVRGHHGPPADAGPLAQVAHAADFVASMADTVPGLAVRISNVAVPALIAGWDDAVALHERMNAAVEALVDLLDG